MCKCVNIYITCNKLTELKLNDLHVVAVNKRCSRHTTLKLKSAAALKQRQKKTSATSVRGSQVC